MSRRDCGLVLAGYRVCDSERRVDRLLARLCEQELLEQTGRGRTANFKITDLGRKRLRVFRPSTNWEKPWDGQWRVFMFDLPAGQGKSRQVLWRALRDQKLGLLQRSVWIWPHEIESYLREVIQAHVMPECFCGFRAASLFLCSDPELVETAWDFETISRGTRRNTPASRALGSPRAGTTRYHHGQIHTLRCNKPQLLIPQGAPEDLAAFPLARRQIKHEHPPLPIPRLLPVRARTKHAQPFAAEIGDFEITITQPVSSSRTPARITAPAADQRAVHCHRRDTRPAPGPQSRRDNISNPHQNNSNANSPCKRMRFLYRTELRPARQTLPIHRYNCNLK